MPARIVLIGAGSLQFGFDMLGDFFQSEVLAGSHVVLHDIDAAALERVRKTGDAFIEEHSIDFTLSATTDRKEALAGADYCVIAIEVGDRFALWAQDRAIPAQYGMKQICGENGGPGGLFHSLRVTPPILAICDDVQRICPDAIVFNYSNPMSRICTTVHRRYPDLRFVGLCHEIASLPHHLPLILEQPIENIAFRAGGLNHFSVMTECRLVDTGEDVTKTVLERAADYFRDVPDFGCILKHIHEVSTGLVDGETAGPIVAPEPWAERGLFRVLLETFGVLPITTDSHLGEYVQWAHEVVDHRAILDFITYYEKYTRRSDATIREHQTERLVSILEGIAQDAGYEEAAVDVPNRGLIPQLPDWIVVEVPGVVDAKGVHGISPGTIPHGFAGLLCNQVAVHDLTAEAILQESKELALQALLVDPVVDHFDDARALLDMMIRVQPEYLGHLR